MTLTQEQIAELSAKLDRANVKTRRQSGRELSYVEGWWAIAEANRIFGVGGWSRETLKTDVVVEKPRKIGEARKDGWGVSYLARVRVGVGDIFRDGTGVGHGIDVDLGQAHESAVKEAETDATKRALSTLGYVFGLALYDKTQEFVADESDDTERYVAECEAFAKHCDDPKELWKWWLAEKQRALMSGSDEIAFEQRVIERGKALRRLAEKEDAK